MTRRLRSLVFLSACLAAGSTALAQSRSASQPQPAAGASSWRSGGAWGAIEASASGGSVVLTFSGGRAVVTQASDGSYVGEWVGGTRTTACPVPRDGAASWGAVQILAMAPNGFVVRLTPCVAAGAPGRPVTTFPATLTAGTSPFVSVGQARAAARSQAAAEPPAARAVQPQVAPAAPTATSSANRATAPRSAAAASPATASSDEEYLAAANASVRDANARTDFAEIARMGARCEQTSDANGHSDGNSIYCSSACRMAAEQQRTAEPVQVRFLVQACETAYARAYGLPDPGHILGPTEAERAASMEEAVARAKARSEQYAAEAKEAEARAWAAQLASVPENFRQYKMPRFVFRIYDLKPGVLKANDYRVSLFFHAYVRAFHARCEAYLPADHVLYEPTYLGYDHTEFGLAFNTRVYSWQTAERTRMKREYLPLYVESKSWSAKLIAEDEFDDIQTILDVMALLFPGQRVHNEAIAAKQDTERLLFVEGCDSAFTKQFEQNLVRAMVDPP